MSTIGPHTPEKGWGLRWLKQSAQLCFRAPSAFAVMTVWVLLVGALNKFVYEVIPGVGIVLVGSLVVTCASAMVILLVMQMLMQEDGHGSISIADLRDRARLLLPAIAIIQIIMLVVAFTIALLMVLMTGPHTGGAGTAAPAARNMFDAIVSEGVDSMFGALICGVIIMPLWLPASTGMEMTWTQARQASTIMHGKMPGVWNATALMPIVLGVVLTSMPFPVMLAGSFLLISWLYVGAREVFGGISENGEKLAEMKLSQV